ncbi:MAG: hypothetical protein ACI8ZB_005062 [Desulforhopalus sp.]|jgi:hypothetical protein
MSLVPLFLTSVVLYIVPEGRVAYWSEWKMLGLSKSQWGDVHINLGWLFLAAGLFHLYLNWKPVVTYTKNKAKELKGFTREFYAGLLLTVVFVVGTLMGVPPLSTILDFGTSFKEAASIRYGEPPYGHAELSSLKTITRRMGLDLEKVLTELSAAGVRYEGADQSVLDVAKDNELTPKDVWLVMQKAQPAEISGAKKTFPDAPFPGVGRQSFQQVCDSYGLDSKEVIFAFEEKGIIVDITQSFKEIANANNTDPHALFEIIHGLVYGK